MKISILLSNEQGNPEIIYNRRAHDDELTTIESKDFRLNEITRNDRKFGRCFFLHVFLLKHDSTKIRVNNESNNNKKKEPKFISITKKLGSKSTKILQKGRKKQTQDRKKGD